MQTRKAKKAQSTDYALGLIVASLTAIRDAGHDPIAALNSSIKAGWSDVYPPKVQGGSTVAGQRNTHKHAAAAATIFEGVWDA